MTRPNPRRPYKAVYAAVVGGLTATTYALADGQLSAPEMVGIALAAVLAGGGTYGVKNPSAPT